MGKSFAVYFSINGSKVFPVLTIEFFLCFFTSKKILKFKKNICFDVLNFFLFHRI